MLRNQSNNAMQLQITTTAQQTERPDGDLPRDYPFFSCALQKETDNDKSRSFSANARVVALSLALFLPKQQVSEDTRGREVDRKNRSRGQFYAEVEKERSREGGREDGERLNWKLAFCSSPAIRYLPRPESGAPRRG